MNKLCHFFNISKLKKVSFIEFVPKYTWVPLFVLLLVNFITYYGTQIFTSQMNYYDVSFLSFDFLPFVPSFIFIYLLAYVQWIIGYVVISRENEQVCYEVLSAELIAKFLCLLIFLLFPTRMSRPDIIGNSLSCVLLRFIYHMDAAVNLFPSIHCLESWMCFRGSKNLLKVPKWYRFVMLISTLLVFLSTIMVHQHVIIDVLGGIIVVEIGLYLSKKYKIGIWFQKICKFVL